MKRFGFLAVILVLVGCQTTKPRIAYHDRPDTPTRQTLAAETNRRSGWKERFALLELLPAPYKNYPGGLNQALADARQARERAREQYGKLYTTMGRADTPSLHQSFPVQLNANKLDGVETLGAYHHGGPTIYLRHEDQVTMTQALRHELTHAWQYYHLAEYPQLDLPFAKLAPNAPPDLHDKAVRRDELNTQLAALKRTYVQATGERVADEHHARAVLRWLDGRTASSLLFDVRSIKRTLRYVTDEPAVRRYMRRVLPQLI